MRKPAIGLAISQLHEIVTSIVNMRFFNNCTEVTLVTTKSANRSIKHHKNQYLDKDINSRPSSESTTVPVNPYVFSAEDFNILQNAGSLQQALSIVAYEPKKIDLKKADKSISLENSTTKQPVVKQLQHELVRKKTAQARSKESKLDPKILKKKTRMYNTTHVSKHKEKIEAPISYSPLSAPSTEQAKVSPATSLSVQGVTADQRVSADTKIELKEKRSKTAKNEERDFERFSRPLQPKMNDRIPRPFSLPSKVLNPPTQATHFRRVQPATEVNLATTSDLRNLNKQQEIAPRQQFARKPSFASPKQIYRASVDPTGQSNLEPLNADGETDYPRQQQSAAVSIAPTRENNASIGKEPKLDRQSATIRQNVETQQVDGHDEGSLPSTDQSARTNNYPPRERREKSQKSKTNHSAAQINYYDDSRKRAQHDAEAEAVLYGRAERRAEPSGWQSGATHHYKVKEETAEELSPPAERRPHTVANARDRNVDYGDQAQGQNEQVAEVQEPPDKAEDLVVEADHQHKQHDKAKGEHSEGEEAASEEHRKGEHEESGDKGEKGYREFEEHDEGEKGHHDKESHDHHYDEKKGKDKEHHDEAGYHEEREKGEEGEREASFSEKGKHNKGHSTKGEHVVHKKDEFEKKTEFFDEFHEGGDFEEEGAHLHEHRHKKGGHHDEAQHHKGHEEKRQGEKHHREKGHHRREKKGHDEREGDERHGEREAKHGEKAGRESAKKWSSHKKGHE